MSHRECERVRPTRCINILVTIRMNERVSRHDVPTRVDRPIMPRNVHAKLLEQVFLRIVMDT